MVENKDFRQKSLTIGLKYAIIVGYNAYGQFYLGGSMDDGTDGDTCQMSGVKY